MHDNQYHFFSLLSKFQSVAMSAGRSGLFWRSKVWSEVVRPVNSWHSNGEGSCGWPNMATVAASYQKFLISHDCSRLISSSESSNTVHKFPLFCIVYFLWAGICIWAPQHALPLCSKELAGQLAAFSFIPHGRNQANLWDRPRRERKTVFFLIFTVMVFLQNHLFPGETWSRSNRVTTGQCRFLLLSAWDSCNICWILIWKPRHRG